MPLYSLIALIWLFPCAIAWNCETCDDSQAASHAKVLLQTSLERYAGGTQKKAIPRPSIGKGPDYVTFGMQLKEYYGANIKENHFTVDIVITLKWMDKRNIHLIPEGADNVTLSQAEAEHSCWMPQVSVTNLKIQKLDVVSTGVMLYRTGEVIKVQRVIVIVMDNYQVKEYPFDSHALEVKIASTQYMTSALQLIPDHSPSWTGVPADQFAATFGLTNWTLFRVEDTNGLLKKSRGVLSMEVKRRLSAFLNQHFIPSMYIVALSCSVFYMPFINQFIMPRLAMSVISYLNFVGLAGSSDAGLPKGHPTTWNELLNQNIELILVLTAGFNIYTAILYHSFGVQVLAQSINNQCKVLMPALHTFVIATIYICGSNHSSRSPVDLTVKIVVAVIVLAFFVVCERRKQESLNRMKEDEEAKADEKEG